LSGNKATSHKAISFSDWDSETAGRRERGTQRIERWREGERERKARE
jgi:hypothetical protein